MRRLHVVVIALACLVAGFAAGVYFGKPYRFPIQSEKTVVWSVGIYEGNDPLDLAPSKRCKNPVLTYPDVTDIRAGFVADPFMIQENGRWYMFFEVLNLDTYQGDIGMATSNDGYQWSYQQIVLDEPFHMSFPHVFRWDQDIYMLPETGAAHELRLYKASEFPTSWEHVATPVSGEYMQDSSIFHYAGMWWIFVGVSSSKGVHDILKLYYAEDLMGPWREHPQSPLINGDAKISRPAGRVVVAGDHLYRLAQNCEPHYGTAVLAFEITELTVSTYAEKAVEQNPILEASGSGWNASGMHTLDAHRRDDGSWIACVDGWRFKKTHTLRF